MQRENHEGTEICPTCGRVLGELSVKTEMGTVCESCKMRIDEWKVQQAAAGISK